MRRNGMPALIHFILTIALLAILGCASVKTTPKAADAVAPPRPQAVDIPFLSDPEQAFKTALEAYKAGNGETALFITRKITEQYPETPWYRRSLFLAEQALIQLDRAPEADAAMLRVQAEYPELADYAVFDLAEYHFAKGRYARAAALYQHLVTRYPKSFLTARSAFRRAQALLESYAYAEAARCFEKFLEDNPRSEFAPLAGMGLGRALTAEADLAGSIQAYRDVWVRYPGGPSDQDAENALAELKAWGVDVPDFSSDELYERGKNLSRANQHEKAMATFARLLEKDPQTPNRPDVLLRTGVAAFYLGKRGEAAVVFERLVREYPADPLTPAALYWSGKTYNNLGDTDRALKSLRRLLDRFPDSELADDALFLAGNIHREAGDLKKAVYFYGRLSDEYPESKFADSAIWWKAWSYYSAAKYKKAEQALQQLVDRYPRSFLACQAYYWQGRAAEKRRDIPRAAVYYKRVLQKFPYTYYGYRSSERMADIAASSDIIEKADVVSDVTTTCGEGPCADDQPSSFETDADTGPPVWTEDTRRLLTAQPAFRKTFELMQLDMRKEAAAELWGLQDKLPKKRGLLIGLSKAFFELGDYYHSIVLVLRNYERFLDGPLGGASEDLWRLAYPQGYWESILSYSRKYKQDPYFIAAVIREESRFFNEAVSPAGARGLMQVMPATGKRVAQLINLQGFDRTKLFDADTVINIGTWYIGNLMKRFRGDPLLAAAAYNAGPEAVASWIARNGYGKDRDAFVESIPFKETRGYVKKVLRNYAEYKRIYGRSADSAPPAPVWPADSAGATVMEPEGKNP
ncbi:MAG TPA: tetratricopeptide repeat protein [Nitrospirota bacterium]